MNKEQSYRRKGWKGGGHREQPIELFYPGKLTNSAPICWSCHFVRL